MIATTLLNIIQFSLQNKQTLQKLYFCRQEKEGNKNNQNNIRNVWHSFFLKSFDINVNLSGVMLQGMLCHRGCGKSQLPKFKLPIFCVAVVPSPLSTNGVSTLFPLSQLVYLSIYINTINQKVFQGGETVLENQAVFDINK